MSLLIVFLPPGPPGEYVWVRSDDGQSVAAHSAAAPALLPAAGRGVEVVAVAAAQQLSWLRATLPHGLKSGSPKLRAALTGLLEDALLDEPQDVHFAVRAAAPGGKEQWVAACRRDWLRAHLDALDAAGRPVARIVPELSPNDGPPIITACGTP
ncbi:MAG: general secretion pathway protein GspL, partial [Ottowia sp.]|nr:general secretion pathway protein GspL [Ottowia sp.]